VAEGNIVIRIYKVQCLQPSNLSTGKKKNVSSIQHLIREVLEIYAALRMVA